MDSILFLVAMPIVIGFLEERKFFEILMEQLLDKASHRAALFFPVMMGLAMLSAALVDEVTSMEHLLGLSKNTLLLGVPFLMAGVALLIQAEKARELVEKRVDWWTPGFPFCSFL